MRGWDLRRVLPGCLLAWLLLAPLTGPLGAYSVLSHEALIDAVWDSIIVPLLLQRFPDATPPELRRAHAYAYGGSVIQDLGYYPLGNHFFSDVTHYARTGDFVHALVTESRTLEEYAFALGALSHFVADEVGHPLAVNLAVPEMYPKLRQQYGNQVTFENDPRAHVMTEFSFDVVQIAGAGYLPFTYHNFIGFQVSRSLLERAFQKTYGLPLSGVFFWERLSFAIYKMSASEVVPALGNHAWKHKRKNLVRLNPQLATPRFNYKLAPGNYNRPATPQGSWLNVWHWQWRQTTKRANSYLIARLAVAFIENMPKLGRLSTLRFKPPTLPVQDLFIDSFDESLAEYELDLTQLRHGEAVLPEVNLDTGNSLAAGRYHLGDRTYARWLHHLARRHFRDLSPAVREDILNFYAQADPPATGRKQTRSWKRTLSELDELRATATSARVSR